MMRLLKGMMDMIGRLFDYFLVGEITCYIFDCNFQIISLFSRFFPLESCENIFLGLSIFVFLLPLSEKTLFFPRLLITLLGARERRCSNP